MKKLPEIYGDEADPFAFLTETEIAFLGMGDAALKKMLTQRATMFLVMYQGFKEYDKKTESFILFSREDWKKKIYRVLNLRFKLTNEQAKGVEDLFWRRVSLPKGGFRK